MYFNGMEKTNFITKKSLTELNKRGYLFKVTEAGLVDECEIIRLK